MKIKQTLTAILMSGIIGISGCNVKDKKFEIETSSDSYPVEQVFIDYNGYRLYFTDERGIVQKKQYRGGYLNTIAGCESLKLATPADVFKKFKYFDKCKEESLIIAKDIPANERCYFVTALYRESALDTEESLFNRVVGLTILRFSPTRRDIKGARFTEIHLPKNQGLNAGIDHNGDTLNPRYDNMMEMK